MTPEIDNVLEQLRAAEQPLGIAVSGGSDSMALMILAAKAGVRAHVATVDHRLRPEAADEARHVAQEAARLGYSHETLVWTGWDGQGNLQDAARRARRRLLSAWAAERVISTVLLGHTLDDQAETVLMRLSRAAGVDGLSAMSARRFDHGVKWWRPLLGVRRATLQQVLQAEGVDWVSDPSNQDPKYARVRMRQLSPALEQAGLSAEALAQVATQMAEARAALDHAAATLGQQIVQQNGAALVVQSAPFWQAPHELRRRLFLMALDWLDPAGYAPRGTSVAQALADLQSGRATSLANVLVRPRQRALWLYRTPESVSDLKCPATEIWGEKWLARSLSAETSRTRDLTMRALGADGLAQLPQTPEKYRLRRALMVEPSLWQGPRLVAAPTVVPHLDWQIECKKTWCDNCAGILSH